MTMLPVTLDPGSGSNATVQLAGGTKVATQIICAAIGKNENLELGLRPECVTITAEGSGTLDGEATIVERLGDRTLVYARLSDGSEITAVDRGDSRLKMGDRVGLLIEGRSAHLFAQDGTGYHSGLPA